MFFNRYGLQIAAGLVALSVGGPALCQEKIFRDDFTGDSLNPAWTLAQVDRDRWALVEGDYFLNVTTNPATNYLVFNESLPADYKVITKIATPPQYLHQQVFVGVFQDDEHVVNLIYTPQINPYDDDSATFAFYKFLKGNMSDFTVRLDKSLSESEPLFLRIVKHGVEYTGEYSFDGRTWKKVGTHVLVSLQGKPIVGSTGKPYPKAPFKAGTVAPESGIKFDYVEIMN